MVCHVVVTWARSRARGRTSSALGRCQRTQEAWRWLQVTGVTGRHCEQAEGRCSETAEEGSGTA